jgi:DNA-binding NarL/FixJ family response regulator
MGERPSRVLIAFSRALERAAFRHALDTAGGLVVVAEVGTGTGIPALVRAHHPRVTVVDTALPDVDGIEVCAELKSREPPVPVVVTSDAADDAVLLGAVEAGADGYIPKDMPLERFVHGVRTVAFGEAFVPAAMLGSLLRHLIDRRRGAHEVFERFLEMTRREREVLRLLVDGYDSKEIADVLVVSPQTVRTHVQNTITKLGAHSRLEATAMAIEHGLVPMSKGVHH